jgi:hypothetical protein
LFGTFTTPALYMAALAFTAFGVHWFALGWNRQAHDVASDRPQHPRRPGRRPVRVGAAALR